jgi:hypothetical protein
MTPFIQRSAPQVRLRDAVNPRLEASNRQDISSSSQGCVYDGAEKKLRRQALSAGALHLPVPTALIRTAGFDSVDGSFITATQEGARSQKKACVTVTSRTPASEVAQGDSRPPSSAS